MLVDLTVDAAGTWCPIPILNLAKAFRGLRSGGVVLLLATDPAVKRDLEAWCASTGNQLVSSRWEGGVFRAHVRKVHD